MAHTNTPKKKVPRCPHCKWFHRGDWKDDYCRVCGKDVKQWDKVDAISGGGHVYQENDWESREFWEEVEELRRERFRKSK